VNLKIPTTTRIPAITGLRGKTTPVIRGEIQIPVEVQGPSMQDGAVQEAHPVVAQPVEDVAAVPARVQDRQVAVTNYFNINRN
jgi:hypothetical protein